MSQGVSPTRLLFATDLHGNLPAYGRLFDLAREQPVDAVILGGDLSPHFSTKSGNPMAAQREFFLGPFRDLLAGLRAERPGPRVFAIPGNDDWAAAQAALEELEADGLLVALHGRAVALNESWHVAGLGYVPVTPFGMSDFDRLDHAGWQPGMWPRRILFSQGDELRAGDPEDFAARPTIAAELEALAALSPPGRTIYVGHGPPAGMGLDLTQSGVGVGSQALTDFIARHQPPLTLHGHIHESPQRSGQISARSGATTSVNPGDSLGNLRAVRIDLEPSGQVSRLDPVS